MSYKPFKNPLKLAEKPRKRAKREKKQKENT